MKYRAVYVWMVLVVVSVATFPALAAEPSEVFTKGPYLQSPGEDTMTIMWESPVEGGAVVKYGREDNPYQQIEVAKSFTVPKQSKQTKDTSLPKDRTYHFYEATLTGLAPGAQYRYSIELEGAATPVRTFRTFDRNAEKITFIAYGDSRSNPAIHGNVAAQFKRHDADFIIHNGDIVARGYQYDLWKKEFFDPLNGILATVPFCPAIGNHEMGGDGKTTLSTTGGNYYRHFRLPGNEVFYSFDDGPVHVLALDYRYPKADHEQYKFAEKDLMESKAPWKIVQLHVPVFNFGGHTSTWGLDTYLPLFHRANVALVIAGHSHLYERFRPIAPEGGDHRPITFITTGGGGAGLYPIFDHASLAVNSMTNHYMVFEATKDSLRGKAIKPDGSAIDAFELVKPSGQYSDEYRKSAVPEEQMLLAFSLKAPLTVRFDARPSTDREVQATFDFSKFVRADQPLELEIDLTPYSAANYALVDGPVRIAVPVGARDAARAKVRIRATGKSKITVSSNKLNPAVVFQAKINSKWGDTVGIGGPCTVKAVAK